MSAHGMARGLLRFGVIAAAASVATVAATASGSARNISHQSSLHAVPARLGKISAARPIPSPAAGEALGGFTKQKWPIVIFVSKDARTLSQVGAGFDMTCTSGATFSVPDGWVSLRVASNGIVHASVPVPPQTGAPSTASVPLTGGTDTITGKLDRKRATFTGKWDLHLNYMLTNGQADQCDSGQVSFSARL